MKSLLFALGLALCCFVQADEDQRFENIDLTSLPRDGIVTAMITNCKKMQKMAAKMPATPISLEKLSEDEVQMTMDIATSKGCKTFKAKFKREDGVFITQCGKGGKKTMEYVQINGKESMFNSITVTHKKGQCKVATLTVTDLAHTSGALSGLKVFAVRHGLEGEETYVLPTEGMCPRSS